MAGGVQLLAAAVPVEDALADESIPVAERERLAELQRVLAFARREGLRVEGAYRRFVDLGARPPVYVLAASPPDRLERLTWRFPLAGEFPYKGFFDLDACLRERAALEARGLETLVTGAAAFSSLGWFEDPVLSSMLEGGRGRSADVLLHELLHRTFFVPGDVRFNESLASFVARVLTERYLSELGGEGAAGLARYRAEQSDRSRLEECVGRARAALADAFEAADREERLAGRDRILRRLAEELAELPFATEEARAWRGRRWSIPLILSFDLYRGDDELLELAWRRWGPDLGRFLSALGELEPGRGAGGATGWAFGALRGRLEAGEPPP